MNLSFLLGNWLGGLIPAALIALLLLFALRRPATPLKCTVAAFGAAVIVALLTAFGNGTGSFTDRLSTLGDFVAIVYVLPPSLAVWGALLLWGWSRDRRDARVDR